MCASSRGARGDECGGASNFAVQRRGARGFTLIELLVTIIIAAIVFAAMVPLFVLASQKSSGDRARNIAMDVAQGRIDSIQLLSWSQLSPASTAQTNLQNDTVPGEVGQGLFGSPYTPPGSSAVYSITYTVAAVPSNSAAMQVTVSVKTPTLLGSPANTATLSTILINPAASTSTTTPSPTPSSTPLPTIATISPLSGPAGTVVTLTGTGFSSATVVTFMGSAAWTLSPPSSDTTISATVPSTASVGASGTLTVTNPTGTSLPSAQSFTVTAPTSGPYTLTVFVSGGNWVNPTTGVTVVQTNVTPNVTDTPSPQFPTYSPVSNGIWTGLPAGTYLVTCNYYKNNKTNGNGPKTVSTPVTITNANQQVSFNLTQ